ncbi:MAG: AmmeMemoRadiSam system protein A [Chloroflexota bacterium]
MDQSPAAAASAAEALRAGSPPDPADALRVGSPPALTAAERASLLRLARAGVEAAVRGSTAPVLDGDRVTPGLSAPRAAFVTLRDRDGELRGCIGNLDDERPTWANVAVAARSAAIRDPRFPPVRPSELDDLVIDVNVLGDPVPLPDPALFDPVVHGVIVERDGRRGLLLPNVGPPLGWGAEETLEAVCLKAGLRADAWRREGTHRRVFATTEFAEGADPPG